MENDLLPAQPVYKLYSDRAIYIGTFLGGPLVGGYMAAENFKQIGESEKVRSTWLISIAVFIVILAAAFLLPAMKQVPNYLIPIIYAAIARLLVKKYQGESINEHIQSGGLTFTTWRAVWIGLVGTAVFLTVAVIFALLADKGLY
ncbi:MAG: hypothetical protein ACTHK8_00035 [Ginsengibacter sp.]